MTIRKTLAGIALSSIIAMPVLAAPPSSRIYQFAVQSDSLRAPAFCFGGSQCVLSQGQVPYLLATLTLTQEALTAGEVRFAAIGNTAVEFNWKSCGFSGGADTGTLMIDDGRLIKFTGPVDRIALPLKPDQLVGSESVGIDIFVSGNRLSGCIDVSVNSPSSIPGDGGEFCYLSMNGADNSWQGQWFCGNSLSFTDELHSFTAISQRVQ
jgi:hypothetical protein